MISAARRSPGCRSVPAPPPTPRAAPLPATCVIVFRLGPDSPAVPFLGEQPVGADPVGVVMGDGGDDQLVGAGRVPELLELVGDLASGADELGVYPVGDQLTVGGGPGMRSVSYTHLTLPTIYS